MLHVRANFVFRLFNVSHSFRGHSANKTCLRFAILNFSEKLQNIFEIGLKKYGEFIQKSFSLKKYFERKNLPTSICHLPYVLFYPLSKFGSNQTNSIWVLAFYNVRFKSKNWFEKTAPKNVNQTGNFYFQPKLKTAISLPIFNLFQWFLFYTRDFIWIITLTQKSKFEDNCQSEGIL